VFASEVEKAVFWLVTPFGNPSNPGFKNGHVLEVKAEKDAIIQRRDDTPTL
jgi:hypothetical protein